MRLDLTEDSDLPAARTGGLRRPDHAARQPRRQRGRRVQRRRGPRGDRLAAGRQRRSCTSRWATTAPGSPRSCARRSSCAASPPSPTCSAGGGSASPLVQLICTQRGGSIEVAPGRARTVFSVRPALLGPARGSGDQRPGRRRRLHGREHPRAASSRAPTGSRSSAVPAPVRRRSRSRPSSTPTWCCSTCTCPT